MRERRKNTLPYPIYPTSPHLDPTPAPHSHPALPFACVYRTSFLTGLRGGDQQGAQRASEGSENIPIQRDHDVQGGQAATSLPKKPRQGECAHLSVGRLVDRLDGRMVGRYVLVCISVSRSVGLSDGRSFSMYVYRSVGQYVCRSIGLTCLSLG